MTAASTSLSSKPCAIGSSVAPRPRSRPPGSRSRASAGRRDAILDAALAIARTGGYDAVHMRTVAERVGIAVGTLYRYYPAKTHLLVAALTREFQRLDVAGDWTGGPGTPTQRLDRLTTHLHERWQRDPLLTDAMTRAFAVADTRAATELDLAAATITTLLAAPSVPVNPHRHTCMSPASSPTSGWPTSSPSSAGACQQPMPAIASTRPPDESSTAPPGTPDTVTML